MTNTTIQSYSFVGYMLHGWHSRLGADARTFIVLSVSNLNQNVLLQVDRHPVHLDLRAPISNNTIEVYPLQDFLDEWNAGKIQIIK